TLSPFDLSLKSCISIKDLNNEFSNCKVWHINNLVIFNKPMELKEKQLDAVWNVRLIRLGLNGEFSAFNRVRKAPRSWQYVYVEGKV
ncbi:MAG TPA: hypothetical protein VJZ51_04210, partial [Bacilli bacterium]|nr:hypothetical protein [Bacilli bacterium]